MFDLDNFDLLLILQAAMHLERSEQVAGDFQLLSQLAQLTQLCDTFVIKHMGRMSLPEFTTAVIYYFEHPEVCSDDLRNSLLNKIGNSVGEFNEYQLHVFSKLVLKHKLEQEAKDGAEGSGLAIVNETLDLLNAEIEQV